jgi:hypothetical protein
MRKMFFLIFTLILTSSILASDSTTTADMPPSGSKNRDTLDTSNNPAKMVLQLDTAAMTASDVQPRCTLDIATEPAGASVSLDGKLYGVSPTVLRNIDTGKHTLVLQKKGYFQKKAVFTLTQQKTSLVFQLSAPGCLKVNSIPDTAEIILNGQKKGTTPFVDSLLKPGVYHFRLTREHYSPVEDSVVLAGGDLINIIDTLHFTDTYRDSVAAAQRLTDSKKRRFSMGMIAGTFGLFLLIMIIVEAQER